VTSPSQPDEFDHRGRVLVVDDQEPNRQLLHDMLELDGHDVLDADNGLTALALAAEHDPDVILLDVTMPGIDGFEVCRRLRASPATSATPVLLITALGEREHRLQGMAAGANDYLVKPIDRSEVSLRVRNAVRMRAMHRALERQFTELQRMERLRDDLVSMIVHDLRSPLTGLRGFLELLQEELRERLSPVFADMLTEAVRAVDQLNGMIGDMLDVSRMEVDALPLRRRRADLRELAGVALAALGPQPSFHHIPIVIAGDVTEVLCDVSLVQRVIVNLLANAMRFAPAGSAVHVATAAEAGGGTVRVRDSGPGIPDAQQQRIFEKFTQLGDSRATRARTSGLGLTFCRMVVDRHGGRIGVTSTPGTGSEFWFWLPGGEGPS
jgi:two-component system, sensor histidine kinase and response regulator